MTKQASIPPRAVGGLDWFALWQQMYDNERNQAEQLTPPEFERFADFWAGQAGRFARAAQSAPQPDGFLQFLLPRLRSTDRVLDIGAGTGRYEPLLMQTVSEVLALEPSAAMRAKLEQRIAEVPHGRVHVIAESWPTADVPPCDVVFAAHVLYGVRDVAPFLQRMHEVAKRACYVLLGVQHPTAFIGAFWERIHGQPRLPLPGALECLNALYQLGIPAQLSLVPILRPFTYQDAEEAFTDICWRLRLAPHSPHEGAVREAIAELLDQDEAGRLTPRNQPSHSAVLWWETE